MTISAGDIKFFRSKVMSDASNGGGGPTGIEIPDGLSNGMFPDVSDLDRTLGRASIRQVHVGVQTDNTDVYLGGNVIIAEPPNDPNVSVTIVQVDDLFATRDQIKARVESYLAPGPVFAGYLFGNMLAGQATVTLLQRPGLMPPNVGDNLVLTKNYGLNTEYIQFVRVTNVSSLARSFDDDSGTFERVVVTLGISDPLRADFNGFDASRIDPNFADQQARTVVSETVVANAARYYGCVPLELAAEMGDFIVKATTIFTRIVPSAQVETPIADARTNGLAGALVASGAPITMAVFAAWGPAQSLFVGGGVMPGTFTVEGSGLTITDDGGALILAGEQVGTIDYENGIAQLSTDPLGGPASLDITYTPAVMPTAVQRSIGVPITINSRSLSYVFTLATIPVRRTLQISYPAGGRWYVLREDGAGRLRGTDSSFGVGTINYTTGTVTVTLGALPDTGAALILQWAEDTAVLPISNTSLQFDGRWVAPLNTSGLLSEEPGSGSITPGSLTLSWTHGGAKTATDDNGVLVGDATGPVDYQAGVVYFAPDTMPPDNTVVTMTQTVAVASVSNVTWASGNAAFPANLTPGTVRISMSASGTITATGLPADVVMGNEGYFSFGGSIVDDGLGVLMFRGQAIGTINYTSGAAHVDFTLGDFTGAEYRKGVEPAFLVRSDAYTFDGTTGPVAARYVSSTGKPAGATLVYSNPAFLLSSTVAYSLVTAVSTPRSVTLSKFIAKLDYVAADHTVTGVGFDFDGKRYFGTNAGQLQTDLNTSTGAKVLVGSVANALGVITLETWTTGATNQITQWRGVQAPPVAGSGDSSANLSVVFRVAAAPVRPGSFSLLATMEDGTTINATAGINGKINHARVKGRINYENGVVELYFCHPGATALGTYDISYMEIPSVSTINLDTVRASTLRYNAVAYSYIPLDASITGLDPVRLPSDGRVPVMRAGYVGVIGNQASVPAATVSDGQTIDCGRVRLSRVAVRGNNGLLIHNGYVTNLEAGTVDFVDVAGYSQPVTVEHRIEDSLLIADAQINGELRFTRPLTHDYPAEGTYVSSALLLSDVYAHVPLVFDQFTWAGVWSDTLEGDAATGTYNYGTYPIELTNDGSITERWALQFTTDTAFRIIGEHVGVIGTGSTGVDCSPINPNTGTAYFTIPFEGWGSGWAPGNALRINTVGAIRPIPLVRTVQQGPEAGLEYSFSLLARGDVDRP